MAKVECVLLSSLEPGEAGFVHWLSTASALYWLRPGRHVFVVGESAGRIVIRVDGSEVQDCHRLFCDQIHICRHYEDAFSQDRVLVSELS